ncbi:MAG: 1-phosphofructokinase [Candidatus Omnitrophota bacterium]
MAKGKIKKYILTVTLNPAVDKIIRVKNFRAGRTSLDKGIVLSAGGKGINVSRVLGRFGLFSMATGFVGGVAGRFIKDGLEREGIKFDFVEIKKDSRTNLTIIDPDTMKVTRILEEGPVIQPPEWARFRERYDLLLRKCSLVVLSGRKAAGLSDGTYAELIKLAHKRKIRTVLDTHGQPLRNGLRAKPFCIKPNREEAEALLGEKLNTLTKVKKAISFFHRQGVAIVMISLGGQGAVASDGEEIWKAVPPRIKCRNSVGCGDAFIGGYVYGIHRGKTLKEALRLAVAAGAANSASLRPGAVEKSQIEKMLARVKMTKV